MRSMLPSPTKTTQPWNSHLLPLYHLAGSIFWSLNVRQSHHHQEEVHTKTISSLSLRFYPRICIYSYTAADRSKSSQSKRCPGGSSAPDEPQTPAVFAQVLYNIMAEGMFHSLLLIIPYSLLPHHSFPPFSPVFFKLHGLFLLQDPAQLKFWPFSRHPYTSQPVGHSSPGLSVFLSYLPSFLAHWFLSYS